MPKLQNVTAAELDAALAAAEDVIMTLHDLHSRMEKGYGDEVDKPVAKARTFSSLARVGSMMCSHLLFKSEMQEDKAELQRLLKERQALSTE